MESSRMKKLVTKKQFIIQTLRRASYRWHARNEAMTRARVSRGLYECAICKKHVGNKEKKMDHVNPVVDPIKGYTTLDEYAERMLPDDHTGYQCLCIPCHDSKTKGENLIRKANKAKIIREIVKKVTKKKSTQLDDLFDELGIGTEIVNKSKKKT